jgi:hypothetical protein
MSPTVHSGGNFHEAPNAASPLSARWLWLAAILVMLAEFLLFDRMTSRHHASVYPRWNDQIQYLTESYRGYEEARAHGLWSGLRTTVTNHAAQGTLHDVLAMLLFLLVGSPSRSAALSLNLLAFLAWQASLLAVFRRLSGSWTVGWLAFALLPCLAGPWSAEPGSAVDFRLDHAAMCLFGASSAVALLTRGFRSTPWSIGLGVVVGFTLLERFLTGAYFAVIFLAAAGWILAGDEKIRRLCNLGLAGLVAAALTGPVFWLNRADIHDYYWVGHIAGAEAAARAPGLAAWESVQFIAGHLGRDHLGTYFSWLASGITLALLAGAIRRPTTAGASPPLAANRDWLFFALIFFLLPALILCFHKQKSPIVVGVLAPGVLLLLGWLWAALWPRVLAARPPGRLARRWPTALVLLAVLASAKFFINQQLRPPHTAEFLAGARRVNEISDHIFAASRAAGLANPRIGVDQVTDALDAQILRVVCYERKKIWMLYQMLLPTSILAEEDHVMFERLAQCDFVLLTDQMSGHGHWPYDQQMRRLYPNLKEWAESHLRRVDTFPIFGREMSLYQRREIP